MSNRNEADRAIETLRQALHADPANLDIADRYCKAIATYPGGDIRSGGDIIGAYRAAALKSPQGVIALASAYRDLFAVSGEQPWPAYFDEDLVRALQHYLPELPEEDRSTVQWILESLKRM